MFGNEFDLIQDVIDDDNNFKNERILDDEIIKASRQLSTLKTKEMKLNKELKNSQKQLLELQKENEQLNESIPKSSYAPDKKNKGSFFIQLRAIESAIENHQQQIEALKDGNNTLRNQHAKSSINRNRLSSQMDNLISQFDSIDTDRESKSMQLSSLNTNLEKITETCNSLKAEIEVLQGNLKEESMIARTFTQKDAQMIMAQKELLAKEVNESKETLERLQNEEHAIKNRFTFNQTKRKKSFTDLSSTSNWWNERIALVAKIKIEKDKLRSIETQNRGSKIRNMKNRDLADDIDLIPTEIKLAILSEKKRIPSQQSQFLLNAMKVEKARTIKLQNQITQLQEKEVELRKFITETTSFIQSNEEISENMIRMDLLKEELATLRAKA